jgi:hypothetical protein
MDFKKIITRIITSATLVLSLHANAGLIEVDPSLSGGSCCGSSERGYYFTTPEELTFTSFWLNTSSGFSSNYNLDILLFNTTPPEFSSSTTDYVTLGSWDGLSGVFNTNVSVDANNIIGLLAWDVNLSTTPYSTGFSQDLNGTSVSFTRLLRQSLVNGDPVSAEATDSIGSIGFTATTTSVPEPSTLIVFALGLMGLAARKLKNKV